MKKFLLKITTLIITFLFLISCSGKNVHAQNILFEDDFSNGYEKWEPTRDDGSMWTITDGKAEVVVNSGFTVTEMVPKNEFWDNEWRNIEYEFDFTPIQGVDRNISFAFENLSNWYEIHFVSSSYNLVRLQDGNVSLNVNESYALANGRTYKIKISYNEGVIKVFVDDKQIANINDWSFNNNYGKIGIKAGTGASRPTKVQFDNIVVRSLDPVDGVQLDVPHFKQSDPQWKDNTYDHATDWSSKPTIGRWGCALSSMAMILNYHGINQLPDSQPLTPDTLNTWLINQPDGYIGEGALNWMAVTRLTRLASENFGTSKLEYSRDNNQSIDKSKSEIDQAKPTILQIDGHFLVANGYTSDGSDLYIKDPAYIYEKFSQHQTNIISTRLFQPSQTDLSYIVLAFKPNLSITLYDPDGNIMNLDQFTETITDPIDNSGESTPLYKYIQLPKPNSGQYKVEVSQNSFQPFDLTIWTYDDQANLSNLTQSGLVGSDSISFIINYDKYGPSSIKRTINFTQFRQALLQMYESKNLKKFYAYRRIDRIAKYGELAPTIIKGRFLPYLQILLDHYQPKMTEYGYQYLVQELQAIAN